MEEKNIGYKVMNANMTCREFQYKVDWNLISEYQKLSEDFCREFKYMLYIKN